MNYAIKPSFTTGVSRSYYSSLKPKLPFESIRHSVINELKKIPVYKTEPTVLTQHYGKLRHNFLENNRMAKHTCQVFKQQFGVDDSYIQKHLFRDHGAIRTPSRDYAMRVISLFLENGYQWLGETPNKKGEDEAHVYQVEAGNCMCIAVPLVLQNDTNSGSNTPDIGAFFVSWPIAAITSSLDPSGDEMSHALSQLKLPQTTLDLFQKGFLSEYHQTVLSNHHYTHNMSLGYTSFGPAFTNHFSEGSFSNGTLSDHLKQNEPVTIHALCKLLEKNIPKESALNTLPVEHYRLTQFSFKADYLTTNAPIRLGFEAPETFMYPEFESRNTYFKLFLDSLLDKNTNTEVMSFLREAEAVAPGFSNLMQSRFLTQCSPKNSGLSDQNIDAILNLASRSQLEFDKTSAALFLKLGNSLVPGFNFEGASTIVNSTKAV